MLKNLPAQCQVQGDNQKQLQLYTQQQKKQYKPTIYHCILY